VAFHSYATDLVDEGDGNPYVDIFVRDLLAGTTIRASVDLAGGPANGGSYDPSVSADGRYVAFHSIATDLVIEYGGGHAVFIRDLLAATTTLASGESGVGGFTRPSISADGRFVAYAKGASSGPGTVLVRDLVNAATLTASLDRHGGTPNGVSNEPAISADGRYVTFRSAATDLLQEGDRNQLIDVFLRDMSLP
jgi:Tol biopolymer transport system component